MRPDAGLLDRLGRAQFVLEGKSGRLGTGQRRSAERGAGIEFVDHRPYEPGDDLRHLDVNQYARRGEFVIRQYMVERALPITILLDATQSMDYGTPGKFGYARTLCAALAFIGLAGGDVVQVAAWQRAQLRWSSRVQGRRSAETLLEWLEQVEVSGRSFDRALRQVAQRVPKGGLLVVVSDWWDEAALAAMLALRATQHLLAVQVLSADEIEPASGAGSAVRFIDSEDGQEVELNVDTATIASYRQALAEWQEQLRRDLLRAGARFATLRTDQPLERALLVDWRRDRIIV